MSTRLSAHFTLEELLETHHRGVDNSPTPEHLENLCRLADFLEDVRRVRVGGGYGRGPGKMVGPLIVRSGYRSTLVNRLVYAHYVALFGRVPRFESDVRLLGIRKAWASLTRDEQRSLGDERPPRSIWTSLHLFGCAADVVPLRSNGTPLELVRSVIASDLQYEEVIFERGERSTWMHIAIPRVAGALPSMRRLMKFPGRDYEAFDFAEAERLLTS